MSQIDGVTSYFFLCRDLAVLDLTKPARNGCQRVGKFAFDLLLGFEAAVLAAFLKALLGRAGEVRVAILEPEICGTPEVTAVGRVEHAIKFKRRW